MLYTTLGQFRSNLLKVLHKMLIVMVSLTAIINTLMGRSAEILIPSAIICVISIIVLYILFRDKKSSVPRYITMAMFPLLALPSTLLMSTNRFGASPYYSMLMMVIVIVLINQVWEFIFPIVMILETSIYYVFYWRIPKDLIGEMSSEMVHTNLIINYIIVAVSMLLLIGTIIKILNDNQKQLVELSNTDYLTKINNRRYILERLSGIVNQNEREHKAFTLVFFDVDDFKFYNDTFGHNMGDEILIALGQAIKNNLRNYDLCGRYGGDEFLVILNNTPEYDAKIVISRILDSFKESTMNLIQREITVSTGITVGMDKSIKELIKEADYHMYKSKSERKHIDPMDFSQL